MAANSGTGCIQGQVALRVPMGNANDLTKYATLPLPGVTITLTAQGARQSAKPPAPPIETEADGTFCFDGLPSGTYIVSYPANTDWGDGTFPALSANRRFVVDAPDGSTCGAGDCGYAGLFEYVVDTTPLAAAVTASARAIETAVQDTAANTKTAADALTNASTAVTGIQGSLGSAAYDVGTISSAISTASTAINSGKYLSSTVDAIQEIRNALQDMAKFPFAGPSDSNGHQPPGRASRTPVAAGSSIRGGVQAALDQLGLSDTTTDADLARLFPAETDAGGEVTYKWAGPAVATRSSIRSNGTGHAGDIAITGRLARFQQQSQTALREVTEAFAIIKPLNGATADDATIATQKAIVLDTIKNIVAEPSRPEGLRPIALDAHFDSLLKDRVLVARKPGGKLVTKKGSLRALQYMMGFTTAAVTDQATESHVTEWLRARDAVESLKSAWKDYRRTKKLKLGERLQELDGYFGALSEGADSARNMLRTVRFATQEQATTQFPIPGGGSVTTDDLLSMVDDLALNIGPKYITDWKGRGIGTIEGRARNLKDIIDAIINPLAPPAKFPFDNSRVYSAFDDIIRQLQGVEDICQHINAGT